MKKSMLLLLAIGMTICLVACGSKAEQTQGGDAEKMTQEEMKEVLEVLEDDEDEEETSGKYRIYDEDVDGNLVENMAFTYNGKTVTVPFTVGDLIDTGLVYKYDTQEMNMIEPGDFNMGGDDLLTANGSWVHVIAYNTTDSTIPFKDCYVTDIAAESNEVTMNGVTSGVSTYEDVLELLGKDREDMSDTYDKDDEDRVFWLSYSAEGTKESVGSRKIDSLSFQCDIEETGLIGEMKMHWND